MDGPITEWLARARGRSNLIRFSVQQPDGPRLASQQVPAILAVKQDVYLLNRVAASFRRTMQYPL